ncbi:ABC transporter ATP-binding protein/permease [Peloplasma aerotolerans]|uniref:ABC transporter ATP-binding protein/permease n=1 Tax=Peloplasma aerotolerans TaxID=3044389 RepID=A0AAW6U7I3_9MOLU|nr:ABC transporter ATP-binding protein/permease [Mariniplasma sp. M4Ah]MDI6452890.1 ABC transporter ATP-binding protein/permease [Mariniplasma sp. M4Ah]
MIKVNHIVKNFGVNNKINVLKDVSIEFPEKGLVVLLGHSGSGKTTFLNVIGGLEKASGGEVVIGDKIVRNRNEKEWDILRSKEIGYIFQNYHLIQHLTVYENVALSLRILGLHDEEEIERRVMYILKSLRMHHFSGRLVTQLSGGQQQRVAIARAIVKNPKVILADEPTGNLDSKNTFDIMNIIKKISEDKLVILVSHEKNLVSFYADRIIEIKDGQITNDYINEKSSHYEIDDNTLYLKDMKKDASIDQNNWKIETYRESDQDDSDYHVTLVVRNDTLYLDVSEPIKNIRIINNEANISIDNTFKSSDEQKWESEISFDLEELNPQKVLTKDKSFISVKKSFIESFFGLFTLSKRMNLMITVFFLMGIVMAIGIPFINNVQSNRMIFASDQENYIYVNGLAPGGPNYRILESLKEPDDELFYINVFRRSQFVFDTVSIDGVQNNFLTADLGLVDHIDESNLVYGRLPENPNEIAIDLSIVLADFSRSRSTLKRVGIWNDQSLIGKRIVNQYLPDRPFIITGIVNTGATRVYAAKEAMVFLGSNHGNNFLSAEMFYQDPDFSYVGNLPTRFNSNRGYYEVLVHEDHVVNFPGLESFDFSNQASFEIDFIVRATGIYSYDSDIQFSTSVLLLPHEDISFRIYQYTISQITVSIYSQSPARTITQVENNFISAIPTWPYQNAVNEGRVFLLGLRTMLVLGILLIVLSVTSIYFMLKSSIASQIHEISIYRALGVKKIDIFKKYLVETFVRLTASSVLSYLLFTIFLDRIDHTLIGQSYYFLVTTWGVIIGIGLIYLIGLVGMIPIFMLLRKSPAQLLGYYDI